MLIRNIKTIKWDKERFFVESIFYLLRFINKIEAYMGIFKRVRIKKGFWLHNSQKIRFTKKI